MGDGRGRSKAKLNVARPRQGDPLTLHLAVGQMSMMEEDGVVDPPQETVQKFISDEAPAKKSGLRAATSRTAGECSSSAVTCDNLCQSIATELRRKEFFWPDWGALAGLLVSGLEVRRSVPQQRNGPRFDERSEASKLRPASGGTGVLPARPNDDLAGYRSLGRGGCTTY